MASSGCVRNGTIILRVRENIYICSSEFQRANFRQIIFKMIRRKVMLVANCVLICLLFAFVESAHSGDDNYPEKLIAEHKEIVAELKRKTEANVAAIISRNNINILQAINKINQFKSEQQHMNYIDISSSVFDSRGSESQRPNKSKNDIQSSLDAHGVQPYLIDEINGMATSYIPRETIIKHVQSHFPEKSLSEVNDIVISAIALTGKNQAHLMDIQISNKLSAQSQREKFNIAKDKMTETIQRRSI